MIVITFVFIVILGIHSLVQPYRKPKHNYIETLPGEFGADLETKICCYPSSNIILTIPLISLPILVCVGYFFWKCKCCKQCRAACCKKAKQSRRGSGQSEVLQSRADEPGGFLMTMYIPMYTNMYMLFQSMLVHKQVLFKFILLCIFHFLINAYTLHTLCMHMHHHTAA